MTPAEIDRKLNDFVCLRCNECCRQPGFVYLKQGEAEVIAEYLKISVYDFTDQYCDLQDKQKLTLKKGAAETCVFLTAEGCSVHEAKPAQCKEFPFKWRTENSLKYCEGMKALGIS